MNEMFHKLLILSRSPLNTRPVLVKNAKLMEEVGEFSEAALFELGYLPHKALKESSFGEAADVIICVVDELSSLHPHMSPDQVIDMLRKHIDWKSDKWERIMKLGLAGYGGSKLLPPTSISGDPLEPSNEGNSND